MGKSEITGLTSRVKGHAALIPARQILNGPIHQRRHRSHTHQVEDGAGHVGGEPERKPVVAEIEHCISIGSEREGTIPELRQHPIQWNLHRSLTVGVLPAGLIQARHRVQGDRTLECGEMGAGGRHHMQMVSAVRQTFEHRREGEFNTTAAPTAELADGCADQHQGQRPIRHALRSPGLLMGDEIHGSQRRWR